MPMIGDCDLQLLVALRGQRQLHIEFAAALLEARRSVADCYGINSHRAEIKVEHVERAFQDLDGNVRARSCDFSQLVVERERDVVVNRSPGINKALLSLGQRESESC